MKRKSLLSLFLILILSLSTLCTNIIYSYAATTTNSSAEITDITELDGTYQGSINYTLDSDKTELKINSSDPSKFDLDVFKSELGSKNVTLDKETDIITLNLSNHADKKLQGTFNFKLDKTDSFSISITDSDGNILTTKELNTDKEKIVNNDEENADSDNDEKEINTVDETKEVTNTQNNKDDDFSWKQSYTLRLSKGPTLEYASGNKATPFLYFGDFFYARKEMKVQEAYQKDTGRGKSGRFNSLTAPNFATVLQKANDKEELHTTSSDEKDNGEIGKEFITKGRHIYTHNMGDGQQKDDVTGSKGTFVTTDIHNYNHVTDQRSMPSMMGPDNLGSTVAMLTIPKLFYKEDPDTGYEQQKLTFQQQYIAGKIKYKIEITIIIKFNKSGEMVTEVNYKNIGDKEFKDFIGFVFHDIAFNKDYAQEYDKSKKIYHGGYVPLRSLGNNRGMYAQSDSIHARVNFHMNKSDSPAAWAARTTTNSSHQFKGYTASGGILSLVFTGILQAKFTGNPWKHHMNDKYRRTPWYQPGNVPEGLFNSFRTFEDPGDKGNEPGAGKRLGRIYKKKGFANFIDEKTYLWDAGMTMRTDPKILEVDDTETIRYSRSFDIIDEKFAPVVILDQNGTLDEPDMIEPDSHNYNLSGSWYDFDSLSTDLYWTMDDETLDSKKKINSYSQSSNDRIDGVPHDWNEKISVKDYKPGLHTVNVWMMDKEGNKSVVKRSSINISRAATNEPQLIITSPHATQNAPFTPNGESLSLHGYWTDLNSSTLKKMSYTIDDGPENLIPDADLNNPHPGKEVLWKIPKLDISHVTDLKPHKLTMTIYDDNDLQGSDTMYFQRKEGTIGLSTPTEISFGEHILAGNDSSKIHPQFEDKLEVTDYRANTGNSMHLLLEINNFQNIKYEKMKLNHLVYWDDQLTDDNLNIGTSTDPKDGNWVTKTDFTDIVKQKLALVFQYDGLPKYGEFNSEWNWSLVDAI